MSKAEKRIPVRKETFERLGDLKGAGETWDDVMKSLLETQQEHNRRALLERTDDDDYVPLEEI